jgi:hypothetical protein
MVQYPTSSGARIGAIGDLRARECLAFQGSGNVDIVGSQVQSPTIPFKLHSVASRVQTTWVDMLF